MQAFKIATLNINGVSSPTKLRILADWLRRQDVDVRFLQEATTPDIGQIPGYTTYYNIGTTMMETVILARSTLQLIKITLLPSGRAMAATLGELRIFNIYVPQK
jgi:exonuclease III